MTSRRKGNLFIISGPSGAGKGTLVRRLLSRVPDAWFSISATTRSKRPREIADVSYHFVSDEEFQNLVEKDGFLEWSKHFSSCYGTPKEPVEQHIRAGDQVILEIDVEGAQQVKNVIPDAVLIFIEPPSLDELERRLSKRGSETQQQCKERRERVEKELSHKARYNHIIINDDIKTAEDELVALIDEYANNKE